MRHEIKGNCFILAFSGDILSTNVGKLKEEIERVMALPEVASCGYTRCHFDLRNTKMIDSMGLNLLVTIVRNEKAHGHKITAEVSSPHLHRTLVFTRMDKQMEIDLVVAA